MLDLPLESLFRPAKKEGGNNPSIFFLHGFGSNMQDLLGLSPYFRKLELHKLTSASLFIKMVGHGLN